MSADNFYVIRKHPLGGFTPVMGFASDERIPRVRRHFHQQFPTVDAAVAWALDDWTEYGVQVHPECEARS